MMPGVSPLNRTLTMATCPRTPLATSSSIALVDRTCRTWYPPCSVSVGRKALIIAPDGSATNTVVDPPDGTFIICSVTGWARIPDLNSGSDVAREPADAEKITATPNYSTNDDDDATKTIHDCAASQRS
jgi:hypothetical protein